MIYISIDVKEMLRFLQVCFGKADFELQHDQTEPFEKTSFGLTPLLEAYGKFISKEWVFDYNCSDCSFPKFRNLETQQVEACPLCGD